MTHKDGFTSIYIEALERVKDRKGLRKVLGQEIDRKSDVKVLLKLADLASYARSKSLERKALAKVAGISPQSPPCLKVECCKRFGEEAVWKGSSGFG